MGPDSAHELAPHSDFRRRTKSLHWNILAVSLVESRFCPEPARCQFDKLLGINVLGRMVKRYDQANSLDFAAKSLFQKILPVSLCGSRFCEHDYSLDEVTWRWYSFRMVLVSSTIRSAYRTSGLSLSARSSVEVASELQSLASASEFDLMGASLALGVY